MTSGRTACEERVLLPSAPRGLRQRRPDDQRDAHNHVVSKQRCPCSWPGVRDASHWGIERSGHPGTSSTGRRHWPRARAPSGIVGRVQGGVRGTARRSSARTAHTTGRSAVSRRAIQSRGEAGPTLTLLPCSTNSRSSFASSRETYRDGETVRLTPDDVGQNGARLSDSKYATLNLYRQHESITCNVYSHRPIVTP